MLARGVAPPTRHARVFLIALVSQWLVMQSRSAFVSTFFNGVPRFAVLAWIAAQSDDSTVVATVSVGIVLLVIWTAAVFRVGFALRTEAVLGTLDLNMLSRSPLVLITLGKAAAVTLSFVPNAVVALLVVLAVAGEPVAVAMLPAFVVAMTLALAALLSVAFIFVPTAFMVGSRAGSFNAIHGDEVRAGVDGGRHHVGDRIDTLDRDIAAPTAQGAARQLEVANHRVVVPVLAAENLSGETEAPDVFLEVVGGHRHETGVAPLNVAVNSSPNSTGTGLSADSKWC